MRELQAMLEKAIKEGKTIEDISEMTKAAQQVVEEEEKKNTSLALLRSTAAIAIAQYISELVGETIDEAEIAEHLKRMETDAFAIMNHEFTPHIPHRPHVTVINGDEAEEAFQKLIEKLGL